MRSESTNQNGKNPTPAQAGASAAGLGVTPAGKNIVEGDPREDATSFDKFADLLKAAYHDSLHRGVVVISFYGEENETWPFTLILAQPFSMSSERYAVLMNEDKAPIYVVDLQEMGWSDVALILLQVAGWSIERIVKVEVEVGERW